MHLSPLVRRRTTTRGCAAVLVALGMWAAGCGGTSAGTTGTSSAATSAGASGGTTSAVAPTVSITAPSAVTSGQAGYAASVADQTGQSYLWTIVNGTILVGERTDSVAFRPGESGTVTLTCRVTSAAGASATGTLAIPITPAPEVKFYLEQALSDEAQGTTLAFDGFGMITGGLGAQSFFPPGKVADYWGFQYLRDNDASDMGHNTSFLTRASCNVLYVLTDAQFELLKTLAVSQVESINLYAWKRYPLMKAFRRLVYGTAPSGTTGLNVEAVKAASRELYVLDGQISYERAVAYATIYRSLTAAQKTYLGAMAGKGWSSWPDKSEADVAARMRGLGQDETVAVMTYAGDLFSWYVGSVTADVYFCPERHGTYFGSFFIKDAPAVGHPGYSIDETMTGTVGRALTDSSLGYVSPAGAAIVNALVESQRANLYASASASIVTARTKISEALRSLITSVAPSAETLAQIKADVAAWSATYGDLDGENNAAYATVFARISAAGGATYLTGAQRAGLAALRKKYMTVTYADGTTVDYSAINTYYLYAAELTEPNSTLAGYTSDAQTDQFFKRY